MPMEMIQHASVNVDVDSMGWDAPFGSPERPLFIDSPAAIGEAIGEAICQRAPLQELRKMYRGQDIIPTDGVQTLMLRNVPETYDPMDVLAELTSFLPPASFNYVRMPQDPRRGKTITYAFVHFVSSDLAQRAFFAISGRRWALAPEAAPCQVSISKEQGLAANMDNFATKDKCDRSLPFLVHYDNGIQRVQVWDGFFATDVRCRLPPAMGSLVRGGDARGHFSAPLLEAQARARLRAAPPPSQFDVRCVPEPHVNRFVRIPVHEVFED